MLYIKSNLHTNERNICIMKTEKSNSRPCPLERKKKEQKVHFKMRTPWKSIRHRTETQKLEYRTTLIEEVPLVDALEPSILEALRAAFVASKFCFIEPLSLFNLTIRSCKGNERMVNFYIGHQWKICN